MCSAPWMARLVLVEVSHIQHQRAFGVAAGGSASGQQALQFRRRDQGAEARDVVQPHESGDVEGSFAEEYGGA